MGGGAGALIGGALYGFTLKSMILGACIGIVVPPVAIFIIGIAASIFTLWLGCRVLEHAG
jgi:hypothetical protein